MAKTTKKRRFGAGGLTGQGPNLPKVIDGGDTTNWSGPGDYSSLRKNSSAGGKTDLGGKGGAPVPKLKSTANVGNKPDRQPKQVKQGDKSFQAAVRGADAGAGYINSKAKSKLKPLFGRSKSATPKTKPTNKPLWAVGFCTALQGQRKKP